MKPKDPIWNFYSALNDGKNSRGKCLDCNAEVSAKKLRLIMSTLGRFFFSFLKYEYQNLAQYISPSQKHNRLKIPIDHFKQY